MGCSTSKPTRADFYDKVVKDIPTIFHHDWDLFPEELQEWLGKTVHKTGTKKLVWDDKTVNFEYSVISKTGIYPEKPDRISQDSFCVVDFMDQPAEKRDTMFVAAAFDGHGSFGDRCSQFASQKLSEMLKISCPANIPICDTISNHLMKINAMLHADRLINKDNPINDISFESDGTTAVCFGIYKDDLYCCNVGDSRCIVGLSNNNQVVAHPFSEDHNPYLPQERERILASGGQVQTQVERLGLAANTAVFSPMNFLHKESDPPRVWKPNMNFPGTAFTRSLGDYCAEEIGVIGEPNVYAQKMSPNVKYIVLASDGIWEFVHNQMVIDILEEYNEYPVECAAAAVVMEAYDKWMTEEESTDDITLIVIRVKSSYVPSTDANRWKSLEESRIK